MHLNDDNQQFSHQKSIASYPISAHGAGTAAMLPSSLAVHGVKPALMLGLRLHPKHCTLRLANFNQQSPFSINLHFLLVPALPLQKRI